MQLEWIESSLKFLLDIYKNEPVGLTEEYASKLETSYSTLADRVKKWCDEGYLEKRRKPNEELTLGGTKNLYLLTDTGKAFLIHLAKEFQDKVGLIVRGKIMTVEEVSKILEKFEKNNADQKKK